MTDLGDGQGEAIGGSSAIVLISGVPAFDVFGLFLGDIPLIGLFLGERPTMGLPLGLFVSPGLGCLVEERRRFWFRREVLKLSCLSSVVAIFTSSRSIYSGLGSNFRTFGPLTLYPLGQEVLSLLCFGVFVSPGWVLFGWRSPTDCIVSTAVNPLGRSTSSQLPPSISYLRNCLGEMRTKNE